MSNIATLIASLSRTESNPYVAGDCVKPYNVIQLPEDKIAGFVSAVGYEGPAEAVFVVTSNLVGDCTLRQDEKYRGRVDPFYFALFQQDKAGNDVVGVVGGVLASPEGRVGNPVGHLQYEAKRCNVPLNIQ